MTEPPRTGAHPDPATTDAAAVDRAAADPAAGGGQDGPTARPRPTPSPRPDPQPATGARPAPGPRPSPTSRARRSAAAVPDGLRRPRPASTAPASAPVPASGTAPAGATAAAGATTATAAPATAEQTTTEQTTAEQTTTAPVTTASHAASDDQAPRAVVLRKQAAEPADVPPHEAEDGPRAARRAPLWLAAVLAVLLLALAGLDGWLLTHQASGGSKSEREQALSTAKTAVPLILSYDYRHFGSDVGAARGRLTGRAVGDYVQAMSKTIEPTAAKVHAVVQAQTDGAGIEAVSGNGKQVTVVVFGEQKVSNTALTAPRIDLFRVRVTLDLVGGQWLVSKFDQI